MVVEIPPPIASKIIEFAEQAKCDDASIKEYSFQGKRAYVFEHGTCMPDRETRVLDSRGQNMGELGGFTGNTLVNGEDFSSAIFVRELWHKAQSN